MDCCVSLPTHHCLSKHLIFSRHTSCGLVSHYVALLRIVAPKTYNCSTVFSPTGAVAKCWTCAPHSYFNNIKAKVCACGCY